MGCGVRSVVVLILFFLTQSASARVIELGLGKRFDDSLLRQVINLDSEHALRMIAQAGIRLLKLTPSATAGGSAGLYSALEEAGEDQVPGDIRKLFLDGEVLGVFLTPTNASYRTDVDTVVVSSRADRWTLVHELTHALIDAKRRAELPESESRRLNNASDAKDDYFELRDKYLLYGRFLSADHRARMVSAFALYHRLMLQFTLDAEIEEIMIEKFLTSLAMTGTHEMLNAEGLERASRYIAFNKAKALNSLDVIRRGAIETEQFLREAGNAEVDRILRDVETAEAWLTSQTQ